MRIIKCDRCGAEIPEIQEYVGYVAVSLKDINEEAGKEVLQE